MEFKIEVESLNSNDPTNQCLCGSLAGGGTGGVE
jgi:hypothetical protein